MQQEIVQIAGRTNQQTSEGVLQIADKKSADTSTTVPEGPADSVQAGVAESSAQDKFYKTMNSFTEVMKEMESGGSSVKWDRKAPVIKAKKSPLTGMVNLGRFSTIRCASWNAPVLSNPGLLLSLLPTDRNTIKSMQNHASKMYL